MWYQVTLLSELAGENDELTILKLTETAPIVIANKGFKTILPRSNVGKAVLLSVKCHIKHEDKRVGVVKDIRPMEKEVIKISREYKGRGVRLLGANKQVIARSDNELGRTKTAFNDYSLERNGKIYDSLSQ